MAAKSADVAAASSAEEQWHHSRTEEAGWRRWSVDDGGAASERRRKRSSAGAAKQRRGSDVRWRHGSVSPDCGAWWVRSGMARIRRAASDQGLWSGMQQVTRLEIGKARRRSVMRLEIGMQQTGDTACAARMMNVGCADANTVMENVIWFGNQRSRRSENNNERSKETPRIGRRLESRPT
ncbi:hypothetical protein Scep_016670 [Stephania cephalantha]|uniref:Uncharacterized protein n=1 Tax=Stephania cephalantha TaxID=152367 RepID=A0AAP0IQ10_9MAGN